MRTIVFELCAEDIDGCMAARAGGADRIELCSALSEGGLTPSHGLIAEAVDRTGLPVHVMLRPRVGDFVYTAQEFAVMRRDLEHARELGVSGFVLGMLRADASVDVERTSELVRMAGSLEVTFHRAFDQTADIFQALEDVIACECRRVLTSGGRQDVELGAQRLAELVSQAAGRIEIALGGGLRLQNAASLARRTGARHFHGSLRRVMSEAARRDGAVMVDEAEPAQEARSFVDSGDVRAMMETLRSA